MASAGGAVVVSMLCVCTDQCVYKDKLYNQGETWDDGCDYTCECLDATTGYYECRPQ